MTHINFLLCDRLPNKPHHQGKFSTVNITVPILSHHKIMIIIVVFITIGIIIIIRTSSLLNIKHPWQPQCTIIMMVIIILKTLYVVI